MFALILQRLAAEAVLDLVYFPLWWYSKGAGHAARGCLELLKRGNDRLAPWLWLRYIFVPMYGQWDWQGRIISFFMRLFQILFRSLFLLVWLVVCAVLFAMWLVFPVVVVYGIVSAMVKH